MPECGCRSGITKERGQLRMEVKPRGFSTDNADSGPLSGGSVCIQNICTTSNVYELETRPRIDSDRCSESILDKHKGVCLSPFLIDRQVSLQSSEGEIQGTDSHCTSVADLAMVCSSLIDAIPKTAAPAKTAISLNKSRQQEVTCWDIT